MKYLIQPVLVFLILQLIPYGLAEDAFGRGGSHAMLAENWVSGTDINGWWMSEKLDGVRGCWDGRELLSKNGNVINAPEWFIRSLPPFPLDGELWTGRGKFSEVSGIVRRKKPDEEWQKVTFCIFDVPDFHLPFESRLEKIRLWLSEHPVSHIRIIEQTACQNKDHLAATLKAIESKNGEGVMLRRPGSLYHTGRSNDILKVKTFHDAEAVVIGHIPGKGKHEGRLGALQVRLANGIKFRIGTGFTDKERENPPPVGSTVTFRYKEFTKAGIPRFASFMRVREEI